GRVWRGPPAAPEGRDPLDRHFRVRAAGKARDRLGFEPRPAFGYVKAAITGEPREHHLNKVERRRLTPGRHITHGSSVLCRYHRMLARGRGAAAGPHPKVLKNFLFLFGARNRS